MSGSKQGIQSMINCSRLKTETDDGIMRMNNKGQMPNNIFQFNHMSGSYKEILTTEQRV